jgi:hypothetical protein
MDGVDNGGIFNTFMHRLEGQNKDCLYGIRDDGSVRTYNVTTHWR